MQEKIAGAQQEIDRRMDRLPGILKADGYPDVQAFKRLYDNATALVEQYNRDLAAWERQVHGGQQPQQKPPEKESMRRGWIAASLLLTSISAILLLLHSKTLLPQKSGLRQDQPDHKPANLVSLRMHMKEYLSSHPKEYYLFLDDCL